MLDERGASVFYVLATLLTRSGPPGSPRRAQRLQTTSRPILLRYSQSATVFAMPVTRTVTPSTTCYSVPSVSAKPEKRTRHSGG